MKLYTVTMLRVSTECSTCVGVCKTEDEAEQLMNATAEKLKLGQLYLHEKGVWSDLDYDHDFDNDFMETIFRIEEQTVLGVALAPIKELSVVLDMDSYLAAYEGMSDDLTLNEKKDLLRSRYYKIVSKTKHVVKCAVNSSGDFIKLELKGDIAPLDLVAFVTDGVASDNPLWKAFALALASKYEC